MRPFSGSILFGAQQHHTNVMVTARAWFFLTRLTVGVRAKFCCTDVHVYNNSSVAGMIGF